ncbi:MAG: 3-deoxy-8-phosphooctulonate synthase [Desulfarculus sp.]|nr:3-deoxy-8-phosphooctulonate synthase [Pseudomonadota bacterium]MBV1716966.1 3-deoxy-8-phosphooctulonate synthase [Desulfarculus sp.]MBU4575472.1 3-deoxy-8-phosphooctulonate synthase [Pseudomonadota bacterium]MBU4597589.1 3-deoxy-8-phosphooctulonate synthase [Pseudomonadota bacterium]MBV1736542.1 3-deoxy-8-phosphooctulonate synthase [Desulfarculus sp.]
MASPVPSVTLGGRSFGRDEFFIIAGPCVLESLELASQVASRLAEVAASLDIPLIFKSSFDKANRTSVTSFRGPGLEQGLEWLGRIKEMTGLPVISDIHSPDQASAAAQVLDVLQIPAFLCRQTDLLVAAGETMKPVNVKKGQFMAPHDVGPIIAKVRSTGNDKVWLTERGSSFGYNNLVVDMRSIAVMRAMGPPVVFDATHSVQLPGGLGLSSGGDRAHAPALARAAVAAGADAVFIETHPDPEHALCDGPNSLPLDQVAALLKQLKAIHALVREEAA